MDVVCGAQRKQEDGNKTRAWFDGGNKGGWEGCNGWTREAGRGAMVGQGRLGGTGEAVESNQCNGWTREAVESIGLGGGVDWPCALCHG